MGYGLSLVLVENLNPSEDTENNSNNCSFPLQKGEIFQEKHSILKTNPSSSLIYERSKQKKIYLKKFGKIECKFICNINNY